MIETASPRLDPHVPSPAHPTRPNPAATQWRFERDPWMAHLESAQRTVGSDTYAMLREWAAKDSRRSFAVTSGHVASAFVEASLSMAPADARASKDLGDLVVQYGLTRLRMQRR